MAVCAFMVCLSPLDACVCYSGEKAMALEAQNLINDSRLRTRLQTVAILHDDLHGTMDWVPGTAITLAAVHIRLD